MKTTRRQEKAAEIARAAIGPLSEQGLGNVRLQDIGASLGMSGAHLLYYFESKNDLFMAALRVVEQDLRDRARAAFTERESARERWDWLMEAGAPMGLHDSGLLMWLEAWALAVHHEAVHDLITELEAAWLGLLREIAEYGKERGELPADLDVEDVIEGVAALLDGLTIRVVVGYRPLTRDRAMRILARFTGPQLPWTSGGTA
ncbi:TetR family transcriptional regulator C-terminal domain-containing protein [Actinocorallia sp. API 0066]|uniref:TetR/AcrR family transcriptional regulator n=1 Tax=Actinocorallia sp. API 0066 TaxID=2896846 RepID=UPI001E4DB32A|nr:TetR family transcriptional regulator C-terminal domain-containing protein [Actinocorallia sp. API 0066]MCD0449711.1 TetR family transcriptional regulator C-terminal domain-containing protein [Actinocorallia sp. API 0066]